MESAPPHEARHLLCPALQLSLFLFSRLIFGTSLTPDNGAAVFLFGRDGVVNSASPLMIGGPSYRIQSLLCRYRVGVDAHLVVPPGALPSPHHSLHSSTTVEILPRLFHSGGPEGVRFFQFSRLRSSLCESALPNPLQQCFLSSCGSMSLFFTQLIFGTLACPISAR